MMEIVVVVLSLTTALLLVTNVRTASKLIEANRLRIEDADRRTGLITTSDRLLAANEEMSRAGLSDERVEEAVRKNPKLIPNELVRSVVQADADLIPYSVILSTLQEQDVVDKAVARLLVESRIQHSWKVVGKLRDKPRSGGRSPVTGRFVSEEDDAKRTAITEKCLHCDLIHRYVIGDRADGDDEGYFRGGVRIATDGSRPECVLTPRPEAQAF